MEVVQQKLYEMQQSIERFDKNYTLRYERADSRLASIVDSYRRIRSNSQALKDTAPPSLHQSVILTWLASRFPILWKHLVTEFSEHVQEFPELSYDNIRSIYNYIEDYENVESDPVIRELIEILANKYKVSSDHYSQVLRVALQAYTIADVQNCPKMTDDAKSQMHDIIFSPLPIDNGFLATMDKDWIIQLMDVIANIQIDQEF